MASCRAKEIWWPLVCVVAVLGILAVHERCDAARSTERTSRSMRQSERPRPQRGRRAIVKPAFISADEVTHQVADKELVLGVVISGEARAYPINMLTGPSREIINDEMGGRAIAATW